ncbi:hypothetical protein HGK72_30865 [Mycolicibacterium fortuitum]|uniref:type IV toxin-antitoxin system AbiEi family antitoxin domain-containing protein n=1 Tax=Mycolicibacterium fortuitum TaxID=1766 RepID=UPI00148F4872|nr:hypothetical protein [Mycolicibacterium fortuitum]
MDEFEPVRWAMAETGVNSAEVVRLILTSKPARDVSKPTVKAVKQPNQLDRLVEFVEGEFDVRAADVVARGICPNTVTANNLLSVACKQGRIDRIGFGVYAARGSA